MVRWLSLLLPLGVLLLLWLRTPADQLVVGRLKAPRSGESECPPGTLPDNAICIPAPSPATQLEQGGGVSLALPSGLPTDLRAYQVPDGAELRVLYDGLLDAPLPATGLALWVATEEIAPPVIRNQKGEAQRSDGDAGWVLYAHEAVESQGSRTVYSLVAKARLRGTLIAFYQLLPGAPPPEGNRQASHALLARDAGLNLDPRAVLRLKPELTPTGKAEPLRQ